MSCIGVLKKEISAIGKRLYNKGFAAGTSGNISVRYENKILITPSGFNLGDVDPEDIVVLDFEGNILEKGKKPSSEKVMHLEIYKARPDISSIIHAHIPKATAFAVANIPLDRPIHSEAFVVLGDVPVVSYATPSSDVLANSVAKCLIDHDSALMANHGVVVCGKELTQTYYKLETLELYAEISLWSKFLGGTREFSQTEIHELVKIQEEIMKQH